MALQLVKSENYLRQSAFALRGANTRDIKSVEVSTFPSHGWQPSNVGICFVRMEAAEQPTIVGHVAEVGYGVASALTGDQLAENALYDLRTVVTVIQERNPLPAGSPALEDLLTRAIALRGRPADVDAWARQIAEDSGDLTD